MTRNIQPACGQIAQVLHAATVEHIEIDGLRNSGIPAQSIDALAERLGAVASSLAADVLRDLISDLSAGNGHALTVGAHSKSHVAANAVRMLNDCVAALTEKPAEAPVLSDEERAERKRKREANKARRKRRQERATAERRQMHAHALGTVCPACDASPGVHCYNPVTDWGMHERRIRLAMETFHDAEETP